MSIIAPLAKRLLQQTFHSPPVNLVVAPHSLFEGRGFRWREQAAIVYSSLQLMPIPGFSRRAFLSSSAITAAAASLHWSREAAGEAAPDADAHRSDALENKLDATSPHICRR